MIGIYDYTVIATYLSLFLGLSGIYSAERGDPETALLCLMATGLLDAFDGRIARSKKNRSEQEKRFGIQIDSLNDLVCFGVLPAAIGCSAGDEPLPFLVTMQFYVLCALIRLAHFNVMEETRQAGTDKVRSHYLGLPVTSSSLLAPLVYLIIREAALPFLPVYGVSLFLFGVLFIAPVHVRKPKLTGILVLAVLGVLEALVLLFF